MNKTDPRLRELARLVLEEFADGRVTSLADEEMEAFAETVFSSELAEAIHRGRIGMARMTELAPVVVAEARSDEVAAGIMERLADEIAALVRVALGRLELTDAAAEVLLGGGLIAAAGETLVDAVGERVGEIASSATVKSTASPPIVGAALLGLDELGAEPSARERLRRELGARSARIGQEASA